MENEEKTQSSKKLPLDLTADRSANRTLNNTVDKTVVSDTRISRKSRETKDDLTQKGSADVVHPKETSNAAKKELKKGKKKEKPKIILQSIAVADENSDSWSEDDYDSTDLEVMYDEADEEKDNEVILARVKRLGNQKGIWNNNTEFYSMALAYLISPDAILSAIYGFRKFGSGTVGPVALIACLVAMPVMFLEMSLGQFTSSSCYAVFNHMAPVLGGLPYLMSLMNLTMLLNDLVIFTMTATIFQDLLDASAHLATSQCFNKWNDIACQNVVNPCASLEKKTGISYINLQGRCVQNKWYTQLLIKDITANVTVRQQRPETQFLVSYLTSVRDDGGTVNVFPSVDLLVYICFTFIMLLAAYKLSNRVSVWFAKFNLLMIFVFLTTVVFTRINKPNDDFVAFAIEDRKLDWMNADLAAWVVLHSFLVSKIGQGGLIAIGSQNHFRSNIFMNTIVIGILAFLLPQLIAYLVYPFMDNMLWRIVHDFNFFNEIKDQFFAVHNEGFNTIWCDTLIAFFADERDGQLFGTLFVTVLVLVFFSHKLIRLKTLIQPAVEKFGLEVSADLDMIRKASLFWIMLIFWFKILVPHKTDAFYATVCGSAIIVLYEVMVVFIFYGPRRLLCNLNLMMFGLVQGSGDIAKTKLRAAYNLFVLILFTLFMVVVPMYLLLLITSSTKEYISRRGNWQRAIGFTSVFFLTVPIYGLVQVLKAYRRKQLVVNLFKPIPNLWGPKEENNRKRAEYEERQLRI